MFDLETMPAEVILDVDEEAETEEPPVAHIVKVGPGESAAAKVLDDVQVNLEIAADAASVPEPTSGSGTDTSTRRSRRPQG